MLKKIFIFTFLVTLISSGQTTEAQDLHYSQFYANPLYLNPAYAGSVRCPRLVANYRNQWPGIAGSFVTYSASFDRHLDDLNGGIGVMFYSDNMAQKTITTNSISAFYSYQISFSRNFSVRAGIQFTYNQTRIDPSKFSFGDMIDPRYGFVLKTAEQFPTQLKSYPDFSAGAIGFSKNYFGGIAVHHIGQPDQAFIRSNANNSKLPMKLTVNAGAIFHIDEQTTVSPNVIYQQQAQFQTLNLGLYFTKGPFVSGLWYRNKDALIALVGFQVAGFKFGYSYDITISQLRNSLGSHEISAIYKIYCKPKKKMFNTVNCPSF